MKTIYYLLIGLLLFSCKKDVVVPEESIVPEETVPEETVPEEYRVIGYYDDQYDYYEIQNSTALVYSEEDLDENVKRGEDSVDINLDGIIDFKIRSTTNLNSNYTTEAYYYGIIPQTGYEVAYVRQGKTIHVGSFYSDFINCYNNGDKQLVLKNKWISTKIDFWVSHKNIPHYPLGPWHSKSHGNYYFAIRKLVGSEYKYGWVEVEFVSREEIYFKRFAIEK